MPSIIPGFEYDIFISYRHNDNKSGWVTEFVAALEEELASTIKEPLTIYFDKNPHDGLLETHDVNKSLEGKLKCLIFVPIISKTYCDPKSFAWQQEFLPFNKSSKEDQFGRDVRLANGNFASRILPVTIHDLDVEDKAVIEKEIGTVLRAIDFIYREPGVNRPLKATDVKGDNQNKTDYFNQVNKVANSVEEIIDSIRKPHTESNTQSKTGTLKAAPITKSKKLLVGIVCVIALFALGILLYPLATPASPGALDKSIAVLPFADMSPQHDQEYFGDGVAEEIINVLVQARDLKVIARTSSFQFKGKNEDLRTIGKMLGVSTVLEGSVRKSENKIRITAQLIKTEDGTHLWSKTFDKDVADVFNVQDEIAASIANAMKATLSPEATSSTNEIWNEEAYKFYQTGRYFFDRGGIDDDKRARDYFKKSLAIDSSHAVVWAYLQAAGFAFPDSPRVKNKALSLDSTNGEALVNEAISAIRSFNHRRAQEFVQKALQYSSSARVLRIACNIYNSLGKLDEALKLGKKAVATDPLQARALDYLGVTYYFLKQYDSAIAIHKRLLELSPNYNGVHAYMAQAYLMKGRPSEAFIEIQQEPLESIRVPYRSAVLFAQGKKTESDADLKWTLRHINDFDANSNLSLIYCERGEIEMAITSLQKAYEIRESGISYFIKVDPMLDAIRKDPRFIAILRRFN
jgi:adenylate cyclase